MKNLKLITAICLLHVGMMHTAQAPVVISEQARDFVTNQAITIAKACLANQQDLQFVTLKDIQAVVSASNHDGTQNLKTAFVKIDQKFIVGAVQAAIDLINLAKS
ncbi:hypothetical protein A3J41_02265 [candidate division TM6 bacterium RIFCSPHIGHO2_12_FULL_38_8]|nr:MAG: hypothetical protein A3J41_02265 [candidate division TM6 bacterium RIFCSPHIGHO2_12_FULL_38_8]